MLSTFIIALREGLEAALIIGILVAYILKTERRHLLAPLWSGVAAAIVGSIGLGLILSKTSEELTERAEKLFVGTTSFLAVALVTWMVFWMKRTARTLRSDLHGKVDSALRTGPLALAGAAFFAVIREGLETALFVYSNFNTVANTGSSALGLILGFAVAISLGYLIFKSAIKLNLSKFFRYTGVALVVVAAGVLSYGVHEFQELGWLPGADSYAWDVSSLIPKDSLLGATLGGLVGFDNTTSWLQLGIWTIYLTTVLGAYLSKPRTRALTPA
ncbi:MAG: iron transporter [Actinobacteria bacterium]|jgi:high-affinity iron transporter|nr:iron transporter [Actinomycetota bacterium]